VAQLADEFLLLTTHLLHYVLSLGMAGTDQESSDKNKVE
jgi:hypothetical protein